MDIERDVMDIEKVVKEFCRKYEDAETLHFHYSGKDIQGACILFFILFFQATVLTKPLFSLTTIATKKMMRGNTIKEYPKLVNV